MFKIAPEGHPFVGTLALLSLGMAMTARVCGGAWDGAVALATLVLVALAGFMLYFFRDPERKTPDRLDAFVSPADGRIIVVRQVVEARYFHKPCLQISIFMSPADVHVNRAPCAGTVVSSRHNTGKHFAAYREGASIRNGQVGLQRLFILIPIKTKNGRNRPGACVETHITPWPCDYSCVRRTTRLCGHF